ncbi:MAG TPA: hypothetical protein VH092_22600 [Urbifossiella sp.]|nr:hypothetical protein [Urbifossiella sp.]
MRRRILMTAVVGVLAAGFGCRHVGGKCDCGAHPADAVILPPSPPYPTAAAPGLPGTAPVPIPPAGTSTGGAKSDAKLDGKSVPDRLPIPMPKQ